MKVLNMVSWNVFISILSIKKVIDINMVSITNNNRYNFLKIWLESKIVSLILYLS